MTGSLSVINGKARAYGIIGNPVSHSFSPKMHSSAFAAVGFNGVYLPFPVEEQDLPRLLEAFVLLQVQGFNVTVPYKEKIIPYLDVLTEEARTLGSVNTVWRERGLWKGHSTDGPGLVRGLLARRWKLKGKRVQLLGAGGSAKAAAFSLLKAGVSYLQISNRTLDKAEALADQLARTFGPGLVGVGLQGQFDLLVNATSLGLSSDETPLEAGELPRFGRIYDLIYNPPKTRLLREAEACGLEIENGLAMLLYQGVEAFELWTGKAAPVEVMEEALLSQLRGG